MRTILVILSALVCCGFTVDSPELRQKQAKIDKEWKAAVIANYDLPALLAFLSQISSEHKKFEDVELPRAEITDKWVFSHCSMVCGPWTFETRDPSKGDFQFCYTYDYPKFVEIVCKKDARERFEVLRVEKNEWLIP